MFGALNRFIGRLDSEPLRHSREDSDDVSFGFQVLRNKNPDLPLEPWFDFIVGINGHAIDDGEPRLFSTEVRNCAGASVTLQIWSAKGQREHVVTAPVPAANPSLGLTLQQAPLTSTEHIWHVLSIPSPLSPAYQSGLLPHSDYIIGTPSGTLRGESALGELVEDHLNRTLVLWVYNSEFDVVREVELVPKRGWGGEGALGAELGYGALHRLPVGLGEEVEGPGEVVFDNGEDHASRPSAESTGQTGGSHFLIPANLASPPPLSPPPGSSAPVPVGPRTPVGHHHHPQRAGRKRHGAIPSDRAFDDYFAEGEQKSREQDYAPSRKGTPLPPPPKAATDLRQSVSSAPDDKDRSSEG